MVRLIVTTVVPISRAATARASAIFSVNEGGEKASQARA